MSLAATTTALVVNYGSHELLRANLGRVSADNPDLRVVVVDNFTTELELRAVDELCAEQGWRLIASPANLGFGGGNNLAATAAIADGSEHLLLLNPDARIDAASLQRLSEIVAADPMALVSPVIETAYGRTWFDGFDLHLERGRMRAARKRLGTDRAELWLTGACLLVSRRLWEAIGGFDDRYFLYWEDLDLCRRAREAGASLAVVPEARAVHDEGGTQQPSGERARSETYYYYNIRNRLLFAAQHLPPADRRRWVRTAPAEAYQILLRGGRRQLLQSWAPWRAAVRGTWDGLRLMRAERR